MNFTKKDVGFLFSNDSYESFDSLKNKLVKALTLGILDRNKKLSVQNDATNNGVYAILPRPREGKVDLPHYHINKKIG